ncbi:EamA family transporter [Rhizobium sp. 2MFCol3.1]|uniref:DMT family transporter n=1 Tax=Rhizobium sp. 2MFCol3.1 TaxID=1246459 RepID=UPI000475BC99|nr:EamA family transporter [Rhizobium sp. 2MFCol3.1]
MSASNYGKFAILCAVWGLTWIAVKYGVTTLPPMLFAALRFVTAGVVFLAVAVWQGRSMRGLAADWLSIFIVSLLMITLCYGPLFWGMTKVPSGTAAVLEMSLTPVCLFVFGMLLRQESWSWAAAIGLAVGSIGLYLLFVGGSRASHDDGAWIGIISVCWAAASSALGSVLAKPTIAKHGSTAVAGATTFLGGLLLAGAASICGENITDLAVSNWTAKAFGGWLFLVIFGSLIGYRLYMQLLRDAGPTRAGMFAFVSPAIAVAVGTFLAREPLTATNLVGMAFMLLSAAVCLYGTRAPPRRMSK